MDWNNGWFYCCLPVGLTLPGSFNHVPTIIFFPVRATESTSVSIDSESTTSQCYSQSFQYYIYLIAGGLWRTGRPLNQSAERSNTLIIDGLNFACLNCTRLETITITKVSRRLLGSKSRTFFLRGRFRSDRAIAERGLPVILRHARARTLLAAMINRSQPQNAALFLCLACIGALPALAGVNVLCCNVPLHNVRRVAGRPDVKITILCIPLNLGIVVLNCLLISLPKRKQSCHVLRKDVIGWGESSVV